MIKIINEIINLSVVVIVGYVILVLIGIIGQDMWIHYDKYHLINTESGMIVDINTDINNINIKDIKGFELLTPKL